MFENAFKYVDDILRKDAGCSTALDYVEQSSWILFLKYLDDFENDRVAAAALTGAEAIVFVGFFDLITSLSSSDDSTSTTLASASVTESASTRYVSVVFFSFVPFGVSTVSIN